MISKVPDKYGTADEIKAYMDGTLDGYIKGYDTCFLRCVLLVAGVFLGALAYQFIWE